MTTLSARDRRVLGIGIVTIVGLVVTLRGAPAWWRWRAEARSEAAEAQTAWLERQALIAAAPGALDTLERRTSQLRELGTPLLTGATLAEASAMLTDLVGEIARSSQVRIDAVDVTVDTTAAPRGLPRIRLDAHATSDIAGLAELVQKLEQGPALLAMRRLAVRPANFAAPADEIETLAIRFTVEGVALVR